MRISHDGWNLFTVGKDGCIFIFEIGDDQESKYRLTPKRDAKGIVMKGKVKDKEGFEIELELKRKVPAKGIKFSKDIMTEIEKIEEFQKKKRSLLTDLENEKNPQSTMIDEKMQTNDQEEKIKELKNQLVKNQV